MEKIKAALRRLFDETGFYHCLLIGVGYCYVKVGGRSEEIVSLRDCTTEDEIVAAIDKYTESLKPKPRPIPEIVKDLSAYISAGIELPHLQKLVGELKQSVDAYYPF